MRTLRQLIGLMILLGGIILPAPASDAAAAKLLSDGRVDDAIFALQTRINKSPQDAESYLLLCRAYLQTGEWNSGIAACEKAVSLNPGNSDYHLWLGRAYGEKADHSNYFTAARLAGRVRDQFELAVRLNPASMDARSDLADFYVEAPGVVGGGTDKAEAEAQEIAKLNPAEAYRVKARISEQEKDYAAAENEYRAAIRLSGGKAGAWLNLARLYRRETRFDEMEDAIRHATAPEMSRPDLFLSAAQILIEAKRDLPQAKQLLRRYLSSGQTAEDAPLFKAHYLLGTLLESDGEKSAAADEYRSSLSLARNFLLAQDALSRLNLSAKSEMN